MSWIPITDLFARVRHYAKRGDTTLSNTELTSVFEEIIQELKPRMKGAEQLYYQIKSWTPIDTDASHPNMGLVYPLEVDVLEFLHVIIEGREYLYTPWERFNSGMCNTRAAVTLGKMNTLSAPTSWAAQLSTRNPANVLPGAYQIAVLAEKPYPAYLGITTDQEYYYAARVSGSGYTHHFVPSPTAVNEVIVKAYSDTGVELATTTVDTSGIPMPVDVPPVRLDQQAGPGSQTYYTITNDGGNIVRVGFYDSDANPGKTLDIRLTMEADGSDANDVDQSWIFDLTDPSNEAGVDMPPHFFNGDSYSFSNNISVTDNSTPNSWTRNYRMTAVDHTNVNTTYYYEQFLTLELTAWELSEQVDPAIYSTGNRATASPVMGIYPEPEADQTYVLDIGAWIAPWRVNAESGTYEIMDSAMSIFRNRMLQDVMIMLAWDERAPYFAQAARTALDAYNEDGKIARNRLTKLAVTRADNQTDINEV